MATLEEENKTRASLKTTLEQLGAITSSALARSDLGGDLNFESGVIYFSRLLRLFHALNDSDSQDVSYQKMIQINQTASQALDLFKNILGFSVTKYQSNPISQRDAFINQARDMYDTTFETVAPAVAFTIRKGTDFARLEEQAKETLGRMNKEFEINQTALKSARESAESIVSEVRKIASEAGVSQHAIYFKDEAELSEKNAKPWLYATIGITCLTLVAGGGVLLRYLWAIPDLTPSQSFQIAIPKLFVFSILLSASIWTGRTYRAYKHNAIVNRHRQNALATFQAFVKATADEATKNAVLVQATQCIFSPQQTGYIQGESDSPSIPPVLEVVRSLGKSGN